MELNDALALRNTHVYLITMHGIYARNQAENFVIPDNVFVIYASKPGYKLASGFLWNDTGFNRITQSNSTFKQYLKGKIEGPEQFKKWHQHVYEPGDTIRNISFLPEKKRKPNIAAKFKHGYLQGVQSTNETNLQSIVNTAGRKDHITIVFVASCRAVQNYNYNIPRVNPLQIVSHQNYNLNNRILQAIVAALKNEKRKKVLALKRKRSNSNNNNKPKPKRTKLMTNNFVHY